MPEEGLKAIRSVIELNCSIFEKAISLLKLLESVNDKDLEKLVTSILKESRSYNAKEELLNILKQALEFVQQEKWVKAEHGRIPIGAVTFGIDIGGEPLYVARAFHEGGLHPGKAGIHLAGARISYGRKEFEKTQYEVLVLPSQFYEWYQCSSVYQIPKMAVKGGYENTGEPLYVSKMVSSTSFVHLGKVGFHLPGACAPFNFKELVLSKFEVMVFTKGMEWMQNSDRLKGIVSSIVVKVNDNSKFRFQF